MAENSATGGQLYIVGLKTLQKLEIQFVPSELNYVRNASIEEIAIVGRNHPHHQYTGGSTRLDFQLDFYSKEESREDVIKKCRWLESLTCNDGYQSPPERVRLVFGKLFRNEVWVVKKVTYKLNNFHKPGGFLPLQAYVDISLSLDTPRNLTINDIR